MDNLNEDLSKTVLSSNESHSAKSSCEASQIIDYMDPITYLSDDREAESQISRVCLSVSMRMSISYYLCVYLHCNVSFVVLLFLYDKLISLDSSVNIAISTLR